MKLFKRRAKPDEIKTEAITDSDHADTETSTDNPAPAGEAGDDAATESGSSVFERLRSGLSRSRGQLSEGLASLVLGKKQLDPALLEALEEQLIMADLGLEATERVLESLRLRLGRSELSAEETVMSAFDDEESENELVQPGVRNK